MRLNLWLLGVVVIIGTFLLVTNIFSAQQSMPVITQSCVQIFTCQDNEGPASCNCSEINTSDGVFPNSSDLVATQSGGPAIINISLNNTDIPDGSQITNTTLIIEWRVDNSASLDCTIEVFNGTWEIVNTTCVTTEAVYDYSLNDFIDNETEAENIRVRINISKNGGGTSALELDHIYVNVTYNPLHLTENYNLTYSNGSIAPDGLEFYRNNTLNASAFWTTDNVTNALVEHNGTGSYVNYSVNDTAGETYFASTANWTNYTLDLSNGTDFTIGGNITVRVHAEDPYGAWNTSVDHYFTLIGESQVNNLIFDSNEINNGTSTNVYCNVSDVDSSIVLENYNVTFYADGSQFNYSLTNSSGISTGLFTDSSTSAGSISIVCNITAGTNYIPSANDNQSGTLSVVLPIHTTENFNLTYSNGSIAPDGLDFYRNQTLNSTSFWTTDNMQVAYTEHNGNGSFVNYTAPLNANWTNDTLDLSNVSLFPTAGNVTVRVHAQDIYGQWNTSVDHYFTLLGDAQINNLILETNPILNGSSTNVYCNVSDINSSIVLSNYNVTFYADGSQFNYSLTNSSGISTGLFTDSSTQAASISIVCNITAGTNYIPSTIDNQSTTLTVNMPNHLTENYNLTYANASNFPNGTVITRRENNLNASAFWTTDNLQLVYVEHDGNGSFVNYTSGFASNWTNYTLQFNRTKSNYTQFPKAGNVTVRVHAQDIYGQWNTSVDHYFSLWGESEVANISFDQSSILNGSTTNFYCNITDTDSIQPLENHNVTFYSNGSQFNYSLTNSSGISTGLFTDTSPSTATFTINCNITDENSIQYTASPADNKSTTLNIVDMNSINLSVNHTVYNRGENLTLTVLDTNNNTINNVTWTINLTWYNSSDNNSSVMFAESNINSTNYTIYINDSYYVTNYTLVANATKEGQSIGETWYFDVSNVLNPVFLSPTAGTSYSPGAIISAPIAQIWNVRNEIVTENLSIDMNCPNGKTSLTNISNNSYRNTLFDCTASSAEGSFNLILNTSDSYNNSGNGTLSLTSASTQIISGGGGGGGGTTTNTTCECTEWQTLECGAGGCPVNSIYQTRTCSPAACQNETRCVASPSCEGVLDFNYTTNTNEITVEQGKGDNFLVILENIGDITLTLNSSIEKTCCETDPIEPFELLTQEIKEIPISVHVPLSQQPGQYSLTVSFFFSDLIKERTVKVNVIENPLVAKLREIRRRLAELSGEIDKNKDAGVNTFALDQLEESIQNTLNNIESTISEDDLQELENLMVFAENNIQIMDAQLQNKIIERAIADNKFNIAGGILASLIISYLVTQLMIPYIKMGRSLTRMVKEEKLLVSTRKATEKQYFTRKIDEKTFNLMMLQGQGKVLKTRSQISQMRETRGELVKSKLTPKALYNWIKSGPKKITGRFHKKKI